MGPGLYQPPSTGMSVAAVLAVTTVSTLFSMAIWTIIRRYRQRSQLPVMWLVAAGISGLISAYDVSLASIENGGTSGIFSLFWFLVIPAYIVGVTIMVVLAAILLR